MKKIVLIALVVLAMIVVACASPTAAPAPTSAPVATKPAASSSASAASSSAPASSAASSAAAVSGAITIWNGYHTGDNEEKALNQLLDAAKKAYPDAKITVLEIPFDQLFNKFETEAATGGGPDMYIAPNDSLGKEARAGLLAPLDSLLTGKLEPFSKLSVQGVTVDGKIYAVPMIPKALAMYYNKTTVTAPPKTTDELLALVKSGKKVGIPNSGYHTFGWWRAFGGNLMDNAGKCVADQGGVADAFKFLMDLKAAGAQIRADGDLDTLYRQGQLDVYFNGPWVLGGNEDALGKDKVGVAPMPKGPKGDAGPLTGIDGWYINANSKNKTSAVNLALFFASKDSQTAYANIAGDPAARTDVAPTNANVKAFADAANVGFPRPLVPQLDNFWGPFGDAATKIFEGKSAPDAAIKEACDAMNKANKIAVTPTSSSSAASSVASSAAPKVELRITWYNDGNEGDVMRAILDKFQAANPNITVKLDTVAYADLGKILQPQVESGTPPDFARVTNLAQFQGYYLDLRPNLTNAATWEANWSPAFLGALRKADDKTGLYGFPTQFTVSGPFINRTLFNQAGVPVPSDKSDKVTWQEWVDAAKKVAAATKTPYAVAIDRSGHRLWGPSLDMCAHYVDGLNEPKFTVDSPGFRNAANMLIGWHKDKITPAEIWVGGGGGYAAGNTFFVNGQLAFYFSGNWQVGQFDQLIGNKFEWDAVPNPYGDCGSTGMPGGAALVAFKASKNPKEVAKLVEYLTSDDVLAEFSAKSLFLPGSLSLSKKGITYPSANKPMNVFLKEVGKLTPESYYLQYNALGQTLNPEMRDRLSQVITGEMTLDEAIKKIQQKMDDAAAAIKK